MLYVLFLERMRKMIWCSWGVFYHGNGSESMSFFMELLHGVFDDFAWKKTGVVLGWFIPAVWIRIWPHCANIWKKTRQYKLLPSRASGTNWFTNNVVQIHTIRYSLPVLYFVMLRWRYMLLNFGYKEITYIFNCLSTWLVSKWYFTDIQQIAGMSLIIDNMLIFSNIFSINASDGEMQYFI